MNLPAGDHQLVQIMDSALAEATERCGPWLACRRGCTQCCHGAFAISPLDALRLRAGMDEMRALDPAQAAEVEHRAVQWVATNGPDFPGDLHTGFLGDSEADRERFEDFANEAPCPALNPATGLCDLYAWRPMTCRVFGPPVRVGDGNALGHCELCCVGAKPEEVARCEMPVPHRLEQELLDQLAEKRETLVAFALLR